MSHRIDHIEKFTATNADILAGGALDTMPGDGYIRVYTCEIVDTGRITIQPAKHATLLVAVLDTSSKELQPLRSGRTIRIMRRRSRWARKLRSDYRVRYPSV